MLLWLMTLLSPSDEAVLELIKVPLEGVVGELKLASLLQIQRVARDVEVPFFPPGKDLRCSLHAVPVFLRTCLDVHDERALAGHGACPVEHRREPELVVEHRLLEQYVGGSVLADERRVGDDPRLILRLDVLERHQLQVELVGQVMDDLPPGATAEIKPTVVQGAAHLHDVPGARHLIFPNEIFVLELVE